MKIRSIAEHDFAPILSLNNANLPAVSKLDIDSLARLHAQSLYSWLIEDLATNKLAGFCIILAPGVDYQSDNYRWLSERHKHFQYLDRIVIAEDSRGKGYGRKLYEHWGEHVDTEPQLLEVNIKPLNAGSIRFHEKLGFHAIGVQDTEGGKKRVQYMGRGL